MMRAMRRSFGLLLAIASVALPLTARAQFYDLDGAYRCLTAPNAACQQDQRDRAPPPPPPAPSGPNLEEVVTKVRDRSAGPREIDFLEKHAAANDARAVEVLAWCRLNGIGAPADAVAAYWLYRQAAALGVANARRNQIAVYETRLSAEQRQQILARENAQ